MARIGAPIGGEKPVLALDIDGVFNAMPPEFNTPEPYTYSPPAGFIENPDPINGLYNPEHGLWIKEFLPIFEVVYLTSHGGDSHEDIGVPLDLPELDWVDYSKYEMAGSKSIDNVNYARRLAVEHFFADRPLVWIDDDHQPRDFDWAAQRSEQGLSTLIVKPIYYVGLERHHIDEVHEWYGAQAIE
ncbi:MAG: hypothetical protein ACHQT9_00470 [Candidatus Saccharimonadales bacterium]